MYQVNALMADVLDLPVRSGSGPVSDVEMRALAVSDALQLVDTAKLATSDAAGVYVALESFFSEIADGLARTAGAIQDAHFMTQVPQRIVQIPAGPASGHVSRW